MGTRPEEWRRQYYSVADFPVTHDGLKQGCKQKAGNGEGKAIAGKHAFRRGFGAIHINLVHQNSLEALVACKLLDVFVAAGLLRQKLITEPHKALRQNPLVFGFELSQCQIAAKSVYCILSYQGNATIMRPWPANFSSRVAKSCSPRYRLLRG